jgi:hypothetical protein
MDLNACLVIDLEMVFVLFYLYKQTDLYLVDLEIIIWGLNLIIK